MNNVLVARNVPDDNVKCACVASRLIMVLFSLSRFRIRYPCNFLCFVDSLHVTLQSTRQAEAPEVVHGRLSERQEENDQRTDNDHPIKEIQDV